MVREGECVDALQLSQSSVVRPREDVYDGDARHAGEGVTIP
jgi:hypothetical protein